MKNVSAAAEEEEEAEAEEEHMTLISDVENLADAEIPDTAHQISTGAFFFSNQTLFIATGLRI